MMALSQTKRQKMVILVLNYLEIYDMFCKLYKSQIVMNEHMIDPYFHVFLGQALSDYSIRLLNEREKQYYKQSSGYYTSGVGAFVSNRINVFSYQSTGTGKGQTMKFIEKLFEAYGLYALYEDGSITPQKLKGGKEDIKGKKVMKEGVLQKYHCIMWSEGEDIVKTSSQEYGNFSTTLRSILDEPGCYTFGARKDLDVDGASPIFYTNASICTGSIVTDVTMNESVLHNGTLQRFLITYKRFTDKEFIDLRKKINELDGIVVYPSERAQELKEFSDCVKEMVHKSRVRCKYSNKIGFNKIDLTEYIAIRAEREAKLLKDFPEGTKKELLHGFLNRNIMYDKKIASQIALIDGHPEIVLDDLKMGMNKSFVCLEDMVRIFSEKYLPVISIDDRKRINLVYRAIEVCVANNKLPSQSMIVDTLQKFSRGEWDLSFHKTREFINKMYADGYILQNKIGKDNAKIYTIPRYLPKNIESLS